MDMLTRLERQMKPVSGANGFKEPDLSEICFQGTPKTNTEIEDGFRILNVRREVMERVMGRRTVLGRAKRHQADAMKARESYRNESDSAIRLELEGRMEEQMAKCLACDEKAKQYEMEITLWMYTLFSGSE